MNWNMDIKDMTGRQIFWVVIAIVVFGGLLVFLEAYKYTVALAFIVMIVYYIARGHLSGKEFDSIEAEEAKKAASRAHQRAIREYANRNIEDRRRRGS